ncbi:SDR family oxidoreductase [Candidatus Latescibacterota bacterium]
MQKVLIAGSTGYLGRYVVKEAKKQGYWIRALVRNKNKVDGLEPYIDEVFEAEVTRPEALVGICDGIDYVISSIGITRQKDGLTYMDVDYQGNRNLLNEAVQQNVKKFIYVSVLNAHKMKDLKIIQAKERFVEDLKTSNLDYSIIRPTGFFSDMLEFLRMANKGKVYLFGNGQNEINPIHGGDLAEICVDAIIEKEKEINIGGPVAYTYKEIAELAFKGLNKPAKISMMPMWMIRLVLPIIRTFSSSKTYGPLEFMMSVMTMDVLGELYGKYNLKDFILENTVRV